MSYVGRQNGDHRREVSSSAMGDDLPAAWLSFIRYCRQLGHGEIEKVKIQDGVPVLAEVAVQKLKFY